ATLADSMLNKPVKVAVTPVSSTVDMITQSIYFVQRKNKVSLLIDLIRSEQMESVLVFSRTKHGADKIAKALVKNNIQAEAIHGNKSQNARVRALSNFKNRTIRVLIATDIAARGIDIDSLSHVVNFDLPEVPETYVHRIGRTGRAGSSGVAIAFCDAEEMQQLRDIQKLIGFQIDVVHGHGYESLEAVKEMLVAQAATQTKAKAKQGYRGSKSNGDYFRRENRAKRSN
ncbi:MAG: helicase-related protein, partial [Mucinivorans sp.]